MSEHTVLDVVTKLRVLEVDNIALRDRLGNLRVLGLAAVEQGKHWKGEARRMARFARSWRGRAEADHETNQELRAVVDRLRDGHSMARSQARGLRVALDIAAKQLEAQAGTCPTDLDLDELPGIDCAEIRGTLEPWECWRSWLLEMAAKELRS